MPDPIPRNDWLQFIDDEYLSQFIRDGGASIKFAVTPDESRAELSSALRALCEERGYLVVHLDAATMRAHMPQDIFFEIARKICWRLLARRRVLSLAEAMGYKVSEVDPEAAENVLEAIASANDLGAEFFRQQIMPEIERAVFMSTDLAKDFRVAMTTLCACECRGGDYAGQPILDWLTGVTTRISGVRRFFIYTEISRTTARYFIQSALHWVRQAGYSGTVVLFDNSRVTLARNPKDGLRYYTKPMTMEHYELLREFIDGADRLAGTLMLVMTNEDFLDPTIQSRGYGIYQALRTRVMNDVYDRIRANPATSLVQLS